MPFEMKVDHERKRIYSRASGKLDAAEIFETTMKTLSDPVLSTFNELMDARDVTNVDLSGDQSYDLASTVRDIDVPEGRRFGVIVASEFFTGLANQYSSFIGALTGDRIQVASFTDPDEAERWTFPDTE